MAWAFGEATVRFFGSSTRSMLPVDELFEKTFALKLVREAPYTLAARLGLSRAQESEWEGAEAATLAGAEDDEGPAVARRSERAGRAGRAGSRG